MNAPHQAVDFIIKNAPAFAKAKSKRVYLEFQTSTRIDFVVMEQNKIVVGKRPMLNNGN